MRFCESVSLLAFGIARYIALFFLNNFIYFGLAESSWLHRHFSNCSEQGLLFVVVWGLLPAVTSSCGAGAIECVGFGSCGLGVQRLWLRGSSTQAQWLWSMALVAPLHVGSSWPKDWTQASCINRQILYHWATREAWCVAFILRKRRMFVKQTKNRNKTSLPSFPPNSRKDSGHRCWYIKLFLPQQLFKIF